jgi:hypothetical protein
VGTPEVEDEAAGGEGVVLRASLASKHLVDFGPENRVCGVVMVPAIVAGILEARIPASPYLVLENMGVSRRSLQNPDVKGLRSKSVKRST